jgi:hypothetical protein
MAASDRFAPRTPRGRRRFRYAVWAGVLAVLAGLVVGYAPVFEASAPLRLDRPFDAPRASTPRRVLLISIDGLAPDVLAESRTPTLDRLAEQGAFATRAETVVPSITLVSHASMLSGVPPEEHGVDWNDYRPWRSIEVVTVFTFCARERLRCGLFAGKPKFVHFAEEERGVERYALGRDSEAVLAAAGAYIESSVPDFAMVHLAEVDLTGHESGWGSPAQRAALEAIDTRLAGFLKQVETAGSRPLTVIVSSDHGGHGTRHGTDLPSDVRIPWIAWGDGITPGEIAEAVSTMDTAPTVLALLGLEAPKAWVGRARFPRR